MLYPFARVNDPMSRAPRRRRAARVLIRRRALDRIGGIGAISGALIDDVALARDGEAGRPDLARP